MELLPFAISLVCSLSDSCNRKPSREAFLVMELRYSPDMNVAGKGHVGRPARVDISKSHVSFCLPIWMLRQLTRITRYRSHSPVLYTTTAFRVFDTRLAYRGPQKILNHTMAPQDVQKHKEGKDKKAKTAVTSTYPLEVRPILIVDYSHDGHLR